MAEQLNYYQLLHLEARQRDSFLSAREVKSAYRHALLSHHPDRKSLQLPNAKGTNEDHSVTIDEIALAYKTLSEPDLRTAYDRWLQSSETNGNITRRPRYTGLETVDLDDLSFDPESALWSRGCRCGDQKGFIVTEPELEKNAEDGELIVGCKGCSLWLRVLFGVDD